LFLKVGDDISNGTDTPPAAVAGSKDNGEAEGFETPPQNQQKSMPPPN